MTVVAAPGRVERLRSSRDLRRVLRRGRRRAAARATVHVLASGEPGIRVATVASRRVGPAVARNRAKRLLREAGRRVAWRDGLDVVLVARPAIAGASMWEVLADLDGAAQRLEVTE